MTSKLMDDLTPFEGSAPGSSAPVGPLLLLKEWSRGWRLEGWWWCFGSCCDGEKETGGGICKPDSAVTSALKNLCMFV